jgi:hypothetical protein
VSSSFENSLEDFRATWLAAWSMSTVRQIERGERDSNLMEDLIFEDLGVRAAAKKRLKILKELK